MKITYLDSWHCFNETIMPAEPVIVKVGVNGIVDLVKARFLFPKAKIVAYEADPENYKRWEQIGKNGICEFIQKAVGKQGPVTLYRYVASGGNSIYPRHTHDKKCRFVDQIQVESISLPVVLEHVGGRIDLLILNCEGSELPIMRTFYSDKVREVVGQICVSFHDPRIYNTGKKMEILSRLTPFYHIMRGTEAPLNADYLLIRKV